MGSAAPNQPQCRGFSAPARTHDGNDLATMNLHIDPGEDRAVVVSKVEVADLYQWFFRHWVTSIVRKAAHLSRQERGPMPVSVVFAL